MRNVRLARHYAHRGFYGEPGVPENSMAAFRKAVEHGLPVELDVHLIADGSLVVFHDEQLYRETGVTGEIEDYNISDLRKLRLEGTDERIPTFDEALDLFEDSGLPLLIELKVARGNYKPLAEAVCRRLDSYKGDFVIESFDPRPLMVARKLRPDFIRGQLAQNYFKNREELPFFLVILLTYMMFNALVKPDFIAYRFDDRDNRALRHAKVREAFWTITTPEQYVQTMKEGAIAIFEQFDPNEINVEDIAR